MASRNADLEERLKELDAANARATQLERLLEETATQITQLEAERDNVPAVAQVAGRGQRGPHPDEHAEDLSHLLFVPGGREGYRLVEQNGPPPIPGSTLELTEDDGTVSKLLVSRVGPPHCRALASPARTLSQQSDSLRGRYRAHREAISSPSRGGQAWLGRGRAVHGAGEASVCCPPARHLPRGRQEGV